MIMRLNKNEHPVGTRALIEEPGWMSGIREVTVIEWAPSGKIVHLRFADGEKWESPPILVEVLPMKEFIEGQIGEVLSGSVLLFAPGEREKRFAQALVDADCVARKRGEEFGLCDHIDKHGNIQVSGWFRAVLNEAKELTVPTFRLEERSVHQCWRTSEQWAQFLTTLRKDAQGGPS